MKGKHVENTEKIKKRLKLIIVTIIILLVAYISYGAYQENQIKTKKQGQTNTELEQSSLAKNDITKETKNNSVIKVKADVPKTYKGYSVCAKLEIPKLEINTNVLQKSESQAMEICVMKFWGGEPNEIGNFCISGHNYITKNMFGYLKKLKLGDELYLTDNKNGRYRYIVNDIYQVKPDNIEPLEEQTNGTRQITLITCTNYSPNRLIIKAIEKEGNER